MMLQMDENLCLWIFIIIKFGLCLYYRLFIYIYFFSNVEVTLSDCEGQVHELHCMVEV